MRARRAAALGAVAAALTLVGCQVVLGLERGVPATATGPDGSGLPADAACSAVSSGSTAMLFGLWGSGADDIWAVGDGGTILHYDGMVWSAVSSGTTESLYGVWGNGRYDLWAVGDSGTILHFDGTSWR